MSLQSERVEIFDINDFLEKNQKRLVEKREEKTVANTFERAYELVKQNLGDFYTDKNISDEEKERKQTLEHEATLGDLNAEKILTTEIENFLRDNNLLGIKFHSFFDSLAQAIFHEIYRFGAMYKWETLEESSSAFITGKELWFKINGKPVKQKEELRDEEHIYEIIRVLESANRGLKVNESNPRAEIEMKNGMRVTVLVPPASLVPTIAFRNFFVNEFSFYEQARRKTIANEDIELFQMLSNLYLNTIISGKVESGKSTMLKTFYGARDEDKVAILIETSAESYLKRDFPNRLVHDFYTKNGDVEEVIRYALRVDHDYMIFQEIRGHEAEGALQSTQRGSRGSLMTYHVTNPQKTAEQLAQHIVDHYPNRKLVNEIRRALNQLDIGIIMSSEGNQKKLASVYELCYDYEKDQGSVNFLIKFNKKTNEWEYNSDISEGLKERMLEYDEILTHQFLELLKEREAISPLFKVQEPILF